MHSACCFLKNLSWMSILGLVLAGLLGHAGFTSTLFILVLLALSLLVFTFSKHKPRFQLDKLLEDDFILTPDKEISPHIEDESIADGKEAQENGDDEEDRKQVDDYLIRSSPAILSENERLDRSSTSEDSEVNFWQFQDNMLQSADFSDGSISDEDSLFEIALPGGNYIGHQEKSANRDPKFNLQKKLQDFVPGSFFKHHGLIDLLAELNDINEEENLIEIDISMGSIKCSRFEIKA